MIKITLILNAICYIGILVFTILSILESKKTRKIIENSKFKKELFNKEDKFKVLQIENFELKLKLKNIYDLIYNENGPYYLNILKYNRNQRKIFSQITTLIFEEVRKFDNEYSM